jgi:DHA1 family multidrug/chloramphenicol efflux transport protein-like MFS transporter
VLYEFIVYSANDMIMPGMIQVVQDFKVDQSYVALSLSYYILGNCILLLFIGFLSERFGKRKIMLAGNLCFLLFTILIAYSQTISQFMLLRLLEGGGLAIIAIGYALIHENFNDRQAVKLISLMANMTLLAPLAGPALGSVIISYFSWHYIFIILAVMSAVSLVGLYKYVPHSESNLPKIDFKQVISQYWQIVSSEKFLLGILSVTLASMPILLWIGLAPNLIIYKLKLSYTAYVIYQIVSIGGLTVASIVMQFIAGKYRIYALIKAGSFIMLSGLIVSAIGSNYMVVIVIGLLIYSLGLGIANGCIMRILMSSKNFPLGMKAAMLGFIQTFLLVIGITVTNKICGHFDFSLPSFTLSCLAFGSLAFLFIKKYIVLYREREWQ